MAASGGLAHRRRTAAEVVRGVGALLLLAALLAGIPAGLLAVAGLPPLPSALPSLDDLLGTLTRPDDGTLLVAVLTWVGWIGWATLAASIIVEIPAAVRGVRAPRLPALAPQQRIAAGLVAAAALLFTGGTASLATGPQPAQAGPAPAEAAAAPSEEMPAPRGDKQVPRAHIVERGDTLWDIAEHHLGNGLRYRELYEVSKHTTQPDGRQMTDPDLIYPGWKITVPEDDERPDSSDKPASAQGADDSVGTDDREHPSRHSNPTSQTIPAPAGSASADRLRTPTVTPSPAEPDPVTTAPTQPAEARALSDIADAEDEDDSPVDPFTVGGIGAVLAGGLLFYLGAQRARQHRHRKPGQRIALPADDAARMEDELRGVQDVAAFDRVNRALRTVAARCAVTGTPLPPVRLARLVGGQLELYLAEPAEFPAPFLPTASPTLWVLDADGDILDTEQADDYPAPYPSLVTIGQDLDGGLVLINLEQAGALSIDGDDAGKEEVLAAIAAELATCLWGDDARVTVVGAVTELTSVLDSGRIRDLEGTDQSLDHLLTEMSNRAAADRSVLADVGTASLSMARATGVAEGTWAPEVLFIARPITDVQRDRLAQLIDAQPRAAIAAVTTAGPPLTEWTIHLHPGEGGHAVLDPLGLALAPQRLGSQDHARLVDLLAATHAEPTTAPQPWHVAGTAGPCLADTAAGPDSMPSDEPPDPSAGHATASMSADAVRSAETGEESAAPLVAVLGPVEIQHAQALSEPTKRAQLTALAAFLAMNPGATRDAVDEAMWPGRQVSMATRNTAMAKLRNWLGTDPDGNDYLPRAATDGYRLHPSVRTDWHMFAELLPNGPATAPTGNLVAALELVRDQPFKGVNPRRYIWAERIQQQMIAAIGDVADELASRALDAGDYRLALKAVMTGLVAEPGSEQLWRHRLRAHHAAGDPIALERAADQLTALADELGGELEDETLELLRELLSHAGPDQPASRREHR